MVLLHNGCGWHWGRAARQCCAPSGAQLVEKVEGLMHNQLRNAVEGWTAASASAEILSPLLYSHVHAPQTGWRSKDRLSLTENFHVPAQD